MRQLRDDAPCSAGMASLWIGSPDGASSRTRRTLAIDPGEQCIHLSMMESCITHDNILINVRLPREFSTKTIARFGYQARSRPSHVGLYDPPSDPPELVDVGAIAHKGLSHSTSIFGH